MAFGREDTDEVYEQLICPVLRERNIQPVRVDRIVHNEDIDDRIIKEIKNADFAIADLTYSRPSVYYEAGYCEREIPVIYTIRRDHLKPRVEDEFGIFRIHFDLQMKNLIEWTEARDASFPSRLAQRIDTSIAPAWKGSKAKAHFSAMPVDVQLGVITSEVLDWLRRLGYREPGDDHSGSNSQELTKSMKTFGFAQCERWISRFRNDVQKHAAQRPVGSLRMVKDDEGAVLSTVRVVVKLMASEEDIIEPTTTDLAGHPVPQIPE